jgi:hypothetical protein
MQQLTNERNNAFLPGELGDRIGQCLLHTLTGPTFPHFFSQADFKGKTRMKSKEKGQSSSLVNLGCVRCPASQLPSRMHPIFFTIFGITLDCLSIFSLVNLCSWGA